MNKVLQNLWVQGLSVIAGSLTLIASTAWSALPPTRVGQCSNTFIDQIGTRLVDGNTGSPVAGSGTSVSLTNGVYLVSYEDVPVLSRDSKSGDTVKLCLRSIPQNCPPGDNRGRIYSLLNYRTGGSVELPDSEHSCGGA